MTCKLFSDDQFVRMGQEVRKVLANVGYLVRHPVVKAMAIQAGCRESAAGRICFDPRQIEEVTARLKATYPPGDKPGMVHDTKAFRTGFGNITAKYYDYARDRAEGGNRENLVTLVRFAHTDDRVTSITIPVSRQDAAPAIEQIEAVAIIAETTNKRIGAVDVTVPEAVPYVAKMGEILGWRGADFIGAAHCINSPLRLEERTAGVMLERKRYHSLSLIASMAGLGGTGPVDLFGTIVLATAEIVGGLILAMIVDPEAPLRGYIASTQIDMRTGNITSSSPGTIRVDAGVCQLMEHCFGGGTFIGATSYATAKRPGMQAVVEKMFKTIGYAGLVHQGLLRFPTWGNLDNGCTISPEQYLLEMEVAEGLNWIGTRPDVPDAADSVAERIGKVVLDDGDFLSSEHTLSHFRDESWDPAFFRYTTQTDSEKTILDRCHERYLEQLKRYTPAAYPDETVRALRTVLKKAQADLL